MFNWVVWVTVPISFVFVSLIVVQHTHYDPESFSAWASVQQTIDRVACSQRVRKEEGKCRTKESQWRSANDTHASEYKELDKMHQDVMFNLNYQKQLVGQQITKNNILKFTLEGVQSDHANCSNYLATQGGELSTCNDQVTTQSGELSKCNDGLVKSMEVSAECEDKAAKLESDLEIQTQAAAVPCCPDCICWVGKWYSSPNTAWLEPGVCGATGSGKSMLQCNSEGALTVTPFTFCSSAPATPFVVLLPQSQQPFIRNAGTDFFWCIKYCCDC